MSALPAPSDSGTGGGDPVHPERRTATFVEMADLMREF